MHSSTSAVFVALLLASGSLAAPITARGAPGKAPSTTSSGSKGSGAAGDIAGAAAAGATSAGLSNLLNEIESHFKRAELDGRGIGSTIGKGVASGAGGALLTNGLQELEGLFQKRGQGDLDPFTDGNLKALLGSIFKKREEEARGLGSTVGKGLASGAGGALLTNGLQEIEGLFQKRGLGSTVGKGLASGAGGALLTNGLQEIEGLFQKRGEGDLNIFANGNLKALVDSIFKRQDFTPEIDGQPLQFGHGPVVTPGDGFKVGELPTRGLGSTVGKGLASGAGGALLTNGLQEIEGLFQKRDGGDLGIFADGDLKVSLDNLKRQIQGSGENPLFGGKFGHGPVVLPGDGFTSGELASRGIGSTVGKGLASGAGGALLTNGIQEIEGLFQRELPSGLSPADFGPGPVILSPEQIQNIQNERRGIGSTIGKGLASGAGGALLTNGLQEIEGLFQREFDGDFDIPTASNKPVHLSPEALKEIGRRGIGSTIGKGLASGAGGALLTNGLQEIEGLFQRSEAMAMNEMD